MKGEIISTQYNFNVKYEEDGVRKDLAILPEIDTTNFKIGDVVEFVESSIESGKGRFYSQTKFARRGKMEPLVKDKIQEYIDDNGKDLISGKVINSKILKNYLNLIII